MTGAAVYVTSSGQLGVLASSERYKTAIAPLGDATERLQRLRPVSFHLKNDPNGALQYGLIAEEVEKVYPELVIRDDTGKIQGVRYDELAPMLLNVVQQQQQTLTAAGDKAAAQERIIKAQSEQLAEVDARMQAQAEQLAEVNVRVSEIPELKRQMARILQLNESMQAALLRRQVQSERVAMR